MRCAVCGTETGAGVSACAVCLARHTEGATAASAADGSTFGFGTLVADDLATTPPATSAMDTGIATTPADLATSIPDLTTISGTFDDTQAGTRDDAFATTIPPRAADDATRPGESVDAESGAIRGGSNFGSRYHIIRMLGAGAMGAVYQAWDNELGVAVALKTIKLPEDADAIATRGLEERFKRELLLARKVTHKSVVRIYDLGVINNTKYITMSYVDGSDLLAILKKDGRLAVPRVLAIAREVIEGLRAAHDAGVVHRDLKPANIMIDSAGQALIMDFGIALSDDGKPRHEGIVGTLAYMSPQQATGQPVDRRTDLYSFGLILYDLLGGRPTTRDADRAMADMLARIGKAPDPIRAANPDVPEAIERLIGKCVEPSVEQRYQSAAEVADDLARLDENGVPIPVPRSHRTAYLATAAIAMSVLGAGGWWMGRRSQAPPVQHQPVSVLIADFDNRAGDRVFTGSLEQALSISMEGASFITAYGRDKAKRIVNQVTPGAPLTADAARLVSRREGITYVLSGSIEQKAPGYAIAVRAIEPGSGKTIASATASARNQTDVLRAVGSAASEIRTDLGETKQESAGQNAAETFTAASLDAMNAYAQGQELANATRNQEALAAYQRAVGFDPEFGRAYAGMGVLYSIFKDEAKAKSSYEMALKYVSRMTDREKYRTLGTYYLTVARNYEKAIENYETLVKLYPGDAVARGNLGLAYLNAGNLKRAVEEAQAVMKLDPKNSVQRYNLAMYSLYAGNLADAITAGATILKQAPKFELAYLPIALSKSIDGDIDGARETYVSLEATGPSGASLAQFGRTDLDMYLGRNADAVKLAAVSLSTDQKTHDAGGVARDSVIEAEAFQALGMKAKAIAAANAAAALSDHESVLFPAARVLLDLGREDDAQRIANRLDRMLQEQTTAYARIISAEIAVRHERYGDAIEMFRDSIKHRDTWMARFLLGRVYAEADHFAEAMAELELCVNRRGEAADVFFYDTPTLRYLPPVYYWLARAQLAMGAKDAAANYEKFLALRADAVPPDPLAADAKRRLATLQ